MARVSKLLGSNFNPNSNFALILILVRTHLDYACCIWSPYKQKYKDALENAQRRATKLINGMSEMSYPDKRRQLNSPAVGSRTQHSLIKFFSLLIINVWDLYNDI